MKDKSKPYVIFVYYMKNLDRKNRQRLHIALHGHTTKKKVGDKVYVSERKGWVEQGAKLARKVAMFPEDVAGEVRKEFEKYRAPYFEFRVSATDAEFEKARKIQGEKRYVGVYPASNVTGKLQRKVLEKLAEPKTFKELYADLPGHSKPSIRSTVYGLVRRGLVMEIGKA